MISIETDGTRDELVAALAGAVEALEYAQRHGLGTTVINGHRVLNERLEYARAVLAKVQPDGGGK